MPLDSSLMHHVMIPGRLVDEATRWCRVQHGEAESRGPHLLWDFSITDPSQRATRRGVARHGAFAFGFRNASDAFAFKMRFG